MDVIAAGEAKNCFGRLLDLAQRKPVTIEKKGRPVVVVMSIEEYERLEELENKFWLEKAEEAEQGGFLGEKESNKLLKELLDAKD